MASDMLVSGVDAGGAPLISVLATMSYDIGRDGLARPCPEIAALQTELVYYEDIQYPGRYAPSLLARDIDTYPWRPATDLVIQGMIVSPAPVTRLDVCLQCRGGRANFSCSIRVTGDRSVERRRGGLALTDPKPFVEMPMRYDKAYGGTDEDAERRHANPERLRLYELALSEDENRELSDFSYPRNPAGKGFLLDLAGVDGLAWPNLEHLDQALSLERLVLPMGRWGERPYPACFDWLPHAFFPRSLFFGAVPETDDAQLPEAEYRLGVLQERDLSRPMLSYIGARGAQGGHPLLARQRLDGSEELRISGMGSDGGELRVVLPGRPPTIRARGNALAPSQLSPLLDLVLIDAGRGRLTLLWRGSAAVPAQSGPIDFRNDYEYRVAW